jgi:hypothetical protein
MPVFLAAFNFLIIKENQQENRKLAILQNVSECNRLNESRLRFPNSELLRIDANKSTDVAQCNGCQNISEIFFVNREIGWVPYLCELFIVDGQNS